MKTKREIIVAIKAIVECYYQDGHFTTIPVYSLDTENRLPESEILKRWSQLMESAGIKK